MLILGGDTDTNAAIVGGLIGAAQGASNFPEDWKDAVLSSENSRPDFLSPRVNFNKFMDALLEKCPKTDENLIIID